MKRYLCCLSLLGVIAIPDWASAFHPCWCPPPPCDSYGPPRLLFPRPLLARPLLPRPLVLAPRFVPAYEVPVVQPQAYAVPAPTFVCPPVITPVIARPQPAPSSPAVAADPMVQPAGGKVKAAEKTRPAEPKKPDVAVAPPTVVPDPPAKAAEPAANASAPMTKAPTAAVKAPESEPKARQPIPKPAAPTLAPELPPDPAPPVIPPLVPGTKESRGPKPVEPSAADATPLPAPAPNELEPSIPPASLPALPKSSEPNKPAAGGEPLPPLVLPPEAPGGSSGIVPESTSRSSPLSAQFQVRVFTATGALRAAATKRIGFFNHTNRDIDLVIEGRAVKLPRKTYIHAEVPPTFTWQHSGNPAKPTTVPADSPGLDVLFREQ